MSKDKYSEYNAFFDAVIENDQQRLRVLDSKIRGLLMAFLKSEYNASHYDAQDCTQDALMRTIERIRANKVRGKKQIVAYLRMAARNIYLNYIDKKQKKMTQRQPISHTRQPVQLKEVLNKEQQAMLQWCLSQLTDSQREFIDYWFKFPDTDGKAVAHHFDISVNNAWIRKHRIIKKLNQCYSCAANR